MILTKYSCEGSGDRKSVLPQDLKTRGDPCREHRLEMSWTLNWFWKWDSSGPVVLMEWERNTPCNQAEVKKAVLQSRHQLEQITVVGEEGR